MKVTICVGSACHIQGAMEVIERVQRYIASRGLADDVELSGCMCTGACANGVCVLADGALYSITPEGVDDFLLNVVEAGVSA